MRASSAGLRTQGGCEILAPTVGHCVGEWGSSERSCVGLARSWSLSCTRPVPVLDFHVQCLTPYPLRCPAITLHPIISGMTPSNLPESWCSLSIPFASAPHI